MERVASEGVPAPAPGAGRLEAIRRSTKTWTGQLVDLTGRNNLLYYRDLRVGSLPLDDVPKSMLFDALAGRSVLLSKLFPEEEPREDAVRRARAVRNKANAHFEERGMETLYLSCGMATWTGQASASTPAAPVLLVPIRLAPKGASQEDFELTVTGELEVNPTFLQMLKADYEINCDPAELLGSAGIEGIIDTPEELVVSFEWLRQQCRSVPGFAVDERFVVGNFSYAKLPMVRDLEGSVDAMLEHEIIAALAGDPEAQAGLRGKGNPGSIPSPDFIPPADEFLVLDADSSQNYAINTVVSGRDLIIKGPPGTGKSQTITNLVATLVARGKRVLFVAEKRAAIDAVLRRLTDVGLDDLVLDLHGGVSSRRKTAEALAAAIATNERLTKPSLDQVHQALEQRREQLNGRVAAVHEPRQPWGISFFEAEAELLGLPPAAEVEVRFRGQALDALTEEAIGEASEDLQAFVGLGGLGLASSGSPWARATLVSSEDAQAWQREVEQLRAQLPAVMGRLAGAASETGLKEAPTVDAWRVWIDLWRELAALLETWQPEVFGLDLEKLLEAAAPLGGGGAGRVAAQVTSGAYRAAKKSLRGALREGKRLSTNEIYSQSGEALALRERWTELASNPSPQPSVPQGLEGLIAGYAELHRRLSDLASLTGLGLLEAPMTDVAKQLDLLLADVPTLSKLPELHRLRTHLDQLGLSELVGELEARSATREVAAWSLRFAWLQSLVEHMQLTDLKLGAFDGEQHRQLVQEFQDADRKHIESTPQRVRRLCAEQAVAAQDAKPEDAALLRAEAAKKRKHLPIRQLFSAVPEVMLSLKPCWAMSPLVVSQVLPSDKPYFDVVVFDEASQIRPAEAMPAIMRGKELVVAGDERQLPPTDFFSANNPEFEEQGPATTLSVGAGYESILEALAGFVDFRMLQWHYRSRDERLITFSNVYMYDRGLTTFPGVVGPDCISHVLVPFVAGEIGSETSGSAEVRCVVDLIIEHAEERPDQSLGVIAMGIKHSDRIDEALREALHDRDDLDEFFDESRHEPFFVKNLERVQGDERDAIILSVGYGKNADGRLLYRFGPLNQEGGERRLNVAVTRAKERMTLVSAFSHVDMDPARSSARGVELLRAYLEYCASNGSQLSLQAREIPELNPFEVDVRDSLTRAGIPLIAQYGASGYRIDYAAKHPTQPGRMVLAIECDGATYHSASTARDRDRLRQEHLERLGWTFHRIWSQDWFNHKPREIERAQEAYSAAVRAADQADAGSGSDLKDQDQATDPAEVEIRMEEAGFQSVARAPCPIQCGRPSIEDYSQGELVSLIRWIESDTRLRTKEQLLTEAIHELGFRRRGHRITAALDGAIASVRG